MSIEYYENRKKKIVQLMDEYCLTPKYCFDASHRAPYNLCKHCREYVEELNKCNDEIDRIAFEKELKRLNISEKEYKKLISGDDTMNFNATEQKIFNKIKETICSRSNSLNKSQRVDEARKLFDLLESDIIKEEQQRQQQQPIFKTQKFNEMTHEMKQLEEITNKYTYNDLIFVDGIKDDDKENLLYKYALEIIMWSRNL